LFYVDKKDLIIGGTLWVLHFNPNVTSLRKLGLPQKFEYIGRYSHNDGNPPYIKLYNSNTNKQFSILYDEDYTTSYNTGHFIISKDRQSLFHRISALKKSNSSPHIKYIASKYVKYIKDEYPEYSI